jgi:type IV pilus assembly protein PilQ
MTSNAQRLAVLIGCALALAPARGAEPNAIRAVEVSDRDGAVELAIQGSRAPSYTVFKLQDPPRLVVDLADADVSAVASPVPVGRGGVVSVSAAQYRDERTSVGRIVVALEGPRAYEVMPRGDGVVVRVLAEGEATRPAAPVAAVAAPAAPASPAADPHVVSRRVDEAAVASAASALTSVKASGERILLATDGGVARLEVIELRDPARLAIDLHGVSRSPRAPVKGAGGFRQVRFGQEQGKVRVVLDAAAALPPYRVERVEGGVAVVLEGRTARAAAPAAGPAPVRAEPAAPARAAAPAAARIADVRFSQKGDSARIEISGRARYAVTRPDARTVVLSLSGAELPRKLERSLDTSAFSGPVLMVSSFNQPSTGEVKIVATLRGPAEDRVEESAAGLSWSFSAARAASAPAAPLAQASEAMAAGFGAAAPVVALSGAPQARGYTGRRITLDFHDIEIRNLLRLIADVSKKNIVVADDVQGKVTVSLRNVPWDQALDLILKSKGLGKEEMGNVVRIAKLDQIAAEQKARAEAEKAREPLIPLKVRLIPVNFARAQDIATRVKDLLTPERGTVSVDERTNVLIVKDVAEVLVRAEGLVRNLDTETPQVLIESRIVEASSNFNRAIGVQWGGNAGLTQLNGNPTGLVFPANASAAGAAGDSPNSGTAGAPNYAVNLPAAIGQGSGGGIGFTFGSIGGAFNLNLRLTALENQGVVKTISAPRIATIDNKEATIGQGISIPFSQVSASGVNTTFIEAKLELKVTPHVTSDGSILLKIKATNNQPNPQLTGANGQPSISKREAETEVLVKDGETTVIGGIYTRATSTRRSEVPWLGKIPLLGFFFRTTATQDDHTELLVFITPRILNRAVATTASAAQ